MNAHDGDSDVDSLFGSPPTSPRPTRGRSLSLALPGSPDAVVDALPKNVGTIALPGSHNTSEPIVNLPASPPRQEATRVGSQRQPVALSRTNLNRERIAFIAGPRKQANNSKRRSKFSVPSHSVASPSLNLPEVNGPLPPNFLRSQQALLGLAGLVGGINPARLTTHKSRGTSAHNPIVVEEVTPSISSSSWKARQQHLPSQLPTPSGDAVTNSLLTQGNILPVLRSLLPLYGANADVGCCSETQRPQHLLYPSTTQAEAFPPPLKRRRLSNVPAGAGDWDVPYPFPQNEGPKDYRQNWSKEREAKLLRELVSLVRDAVRRAAAKQLTDEKQKKETETKYMPGVYYRPKVVESDTSSRQSTPAALPAHSHTSPPVVECPPPAPSQPEQSDLEDFLSALDLHLSNPDARLTNDEFAALSSSFDISTTATNSPTLTSSTRLPTPFDFTDVSTTANKENNVPGVSMDFDETFFSSSTTADFDFGLDFPVDPALLQLSVPAPPALDILQGIPLTPVYGGTGQVDLSSYDHEPIPQNGVTQVVDHISVLESPVVVHPLFHEQSNSAVASSVPRPDVLVKEPLVAGPSVPLSIDPPLDCPRTSVPSVQDQVPVITLPLPAPKGVTFLPLIPGTTFAARASNAKSTSKTLDRQEILRKAKQRREQLAAELARTKIELWETTIEQGVLINLSKDKDLQ